MVSKTPRCEFGEVTDMTAGSNSSVLRMSDFRGAVTIHLHQYIRPTLPLEVHRSFKFRRRLGTEALTVL